MSGPPAHSALSPLGRGRWLASCDGEGSFFACIGGPAPYNALSFWPFGDILVPYRLRTSLSGKWRTETNGQGQIGLKSSLQWLRVAFPDAYKQWF